MPLPTDNDPSATGAGVGNSVTSYQLGPISAGSDSFLGGLFGSLQGFSTYATGLGSNFGAGLNLAVNNPQAAAFVLRADQNQQYSPDQISAIKAAETQGLSSNPFNAVGQIVGGVFGTGVSTIGQVTGVAGATAAPGTSAGFQQGVGGVAEVGAAGASGAFGGAISGLGAGLSTTLGQNAGNTNLIFVAVVVLVIALAVM